MRILLIEDDKDVIQSVEPGLEAECFVVDVVEDGERGSFLARTNDYDLILLDDGLPKKNGDVVCKEIRKAKKPTPIIFLSAVSRTETKIELFGHGIDDYVTKPFSFEELLARARAILRRPPHIIGDILEIGTLCLNTKTHRVTRQDRDLYLTRKEFMLLEYLMKNQGTVLTRSMIMEHVWDMNADPFSNTIESHVLSLRKKIDPRNKQRLIRTIPGRGYTIAARR